jgi:hypothetical protein
MKELVTSSNETMNPIGPAATQQPLALAADTAYDVIVHRAR